MDPVFHFFRVVALASIRSSFLSNLEKLLKSIRFGEYCLTEHHGLVAGPAGP